MNNNQNQIVDRLKAVGLKFVGGGLVLLVTTSVGLYLLQEKLIYHPGQNLNLYSQILLAIGFSRYSQENPSHFRNPLERNIPYEDVEIQVPDGIILKGWFMKQQFPSQCSTLVFFHENAGNLGTRLHYFQYYFNLVKCNILAVSYRGFDDSTGSPCQEGIEKDGIAILKYIFEQREDIDKKRIFAHGRSLGGAVAVSSCVSQDYQLRGLILENTFTSIKDIINSKISLIAPLSNLILKNKWETKYLIGKVSCPVFFIRSTQDEIVPDQQMKKLYELCKSQKKQFIIEGGTHNENWIMSKDEYFKELNKFIN